MGTSVVSKISTQHHNSVDDQGRLIAIASSMAIKVALKRLVYHRLYFPTSI